jgi:hypothetical protein
MYCDELEKTANDLIAAARAAEVEKWRKCVFSCWEDFYGTWRFYLGELYWLSRVRSDHRDPKQHPCYATLAKFDRRSQQSLGTETVNKLSHEYNELVLWCLREDAPTEKVPEKVVTKKWWRFWK